MSGQEMILGGVKVLDVGTFVFGPAAATVMSDFGAEVIKVETPGIGDPYRYLGQMPPLPACDHNYCWILDSRNKKSIALNLKKKEARDVLLRLVREADVFLTNFPPAVLSRLRLTYDELAPLNERLIYAHATGYGEHGDESNKPGYDATAWWARSGLMDLVRPGNGDLGLSMPGMGDHPSAMALFGAIMMALYQRERTRKGSKVMTSLLANGAWANSILIQAILCGGPPLQRITRKETPNALANTYECKDGRWFLLALVREEKDWESFATCIGRPDLITDPRFAEKAARRVNSGALIEILDETFGTREYTQWKEIMDKHGITFGVVAQLEDIPGDPQMAANDIFMEIDDPRISRMRTVNSPIWVEGQPKAKPTLAPEIGEHTEEVLTSLGYDANTIKALREGGAIP